MRTLAVVALAAMLAAGCSDGNRTVPPEPNPDTAENMAAPDTSPATGEEHAERNTPDTGNGEPDVGNDLETGYVVVAGGLDSPWSIAFLEDVIYVSERDGGIVRIESGKATRERLELGKPVNQTGESGFMGFVLSPDFASDRTAYAYHSYKENGGTFNRIVKLREEDGIWTETDALLESIPGASFHDGGRLAFGPDGMLYATTGDAGDEPLAQDRDSLAGKILRLKPDGGIPDDNPFPGSYVYSYGHRNPQGLGWGADGTMYASEHGPSGRPGGHDELNVIEPGSNYGWPNAIGDETGNGLTPPIYHTGDDTLAPSGIAVTESGAILAAGLRGERLAAFTVDGEPLADLLSGEGRLRDVKLHGGEVYVLTNNTDGRGTPDAADDRLLKLKGVEIP